jgi:hypothetical protein
MSALYLERYLNYGLTAEELRSSGSHRAEATSFPATATTATWHSACETA